MEYSSEAGLGGDQIGNFHDYRFSSENFNHQLTSDVWDPKDVDGEYLMTVTNSQGWSLERTFSVRSGKINGYSEYVFEVP